jgi:hypothetical protein
MSADGKLSIILEKRLDDSNNVYYIGKLKAPVQIDARDGICFLIFTAIEGEEEIQIAAMTHNSYKRDREERK